MVPDPVSKTIHIYVDAKIEFDIPITVLQEETLTCGWLLSEASRRYGILKTNGKRKKIVALKSTDQAEGLDMYLLDAKNSLKPLPDGLFLIAHLKKLSGDTDVSINSFEQLKVIGRGGFSRVVLARKKDTGMLYAMKIITKTANNTQKQSRVKSERDIMI